MKKLMVVFLFFSASSNTMHVKLPTIKETYKVLEVLQSEKAQGDKVSACALQELYSLANQPGEYRFQNRKCEEKLIFLGVINRNYPQVQIQHAANIAMLSYESNLLEKDL